MFFVFICPKCGYRGVYGYQNIIDSEKCKEKCKRSIEILERLLKIIQAVELYSLIQNIDKQLKRLLFEEKED
jgi:hypothetical protein